jgi:hypothetical protein
LKYLSISLLGANHTSIAEESRNWQVNLANKGFSVNAIDFSAIENMLVELKRRLSESRSQTVDRIRNAWSAQQLLFQTLLAREIEQHDSQQDCEQTLPGNTWQRQNHAESDQQHARNILADDLRGMKRRPRSRPEFRFAVPAEVVRR